MRVVWSGTLIPSLITLVAGFGLGVYRERAAQKNAANYERWKIQQAEAKATLPLLKEMVDFLVKSRSGGDVPLTEARHRISAVENACFSLRRRVPVEWGALYTAATLAAFGGAGVLGYDFPTRSDDEVAFELLKPANDFTSALKEIAMSSYDRKVTY